MQSSESSKYILLQLMKPPGGAFSARLVVSSGQEAHMFFGGWGKQFQCLIFLTSGG